MKAFFLFFLFLISSLLWSLDPLEYHESFPVKILGSTPEQAWFFLGPPDSLQLVSSDSDNPVISTPFDEGITLYWYDNRLWQIEFSHPWNKDFWNISLGMERPEIILSLGAPFMQTSEMMLYSLPDIGFPVEGRFYFNELGQLEQIYYYRSDF